MDKHIRSGLCGRPQSGLTALIQCLAIFGSTLVGEAAPPGRHRSANLSRVDVRAINARLPVGSRVVEIRRPLTEADFEAILRFLPIFEEEGFEAGEWLHVEAEPPFLAHGAQADAFIRALYGQHWILPGFDWAAWGNEMGMTPDEWLEYLPTAPLEDIRKLLTAHVRNDRFCGGHLAGVFESGEMTAIMRRVKALGAGE